MAGADFKLKCLSLFGNAGMQQAELAARAKALQRTSGGRLSVVVGPPPVGTPHWCGVNAFDSDG